MSSIMSFSIHGQRERILRGAAAGGDTNTGKEEGSISSSEYLPGTWTAVEVANFPSFAFSSRLANTSDIVSRTTLSISSMGSSRSSRSLDCERPSQRLSLSEGSSPSSIGVTTEWEIADEARIGDSCTILEGGGDLNLGTVAVLIF